MSRPITLFLGLLCVPIIHRLYATIGSAQLLSSAPLTHLAIIMDGNRRWAHQRNLLTTMGHEKGADTVKTLLKFCLARNIEIVSVYAFSLENFKRSPEEIQDIFNLIVNQTESTLPDLLRQGIRVRFVGAVKEAPRKVQQAIERIEEQTKECDKLLLNVLFCYGGRQEIMSAIKNIVRDLKEGKLKDAPSEETFKEYLWTSGLPDPDLIIRTGGEQRLSNFLTYQTSYSELYFTDRLWPELTFQDFEDAVGDYHLRNRNFGR